GVAQPRVPRSRAGSGRAVSLHHPGRDPAQHDLADPGDVPDHRGLRRARRRGAAVHRTRRPDRPELGHDAVLGQEQRRDPGRVAAVGDRAGALHRGARRRVRAPQLRVRRSQQPGAAAHPQSDREMSSVATRPLLQVTDLCVDYLTEGAAVRAVDHVSLELSRGEFLGIVGESGCGKSTLLYAVAKLLTPPARIASGDVWFDGHDIVSMSDAELRHLRWRQYSVVMQSAMNALNPVMTVGEQLRDTFDAHEHYSAQQVKARSEELLLIVGIDQVHLRSYPHQLSGGMRQRAMIAMALALTPDLVIMDEPTSALDVVAQRSLMVKIQQLQREFG